MEFKSNFMMFNGAYLTIDGTTIDSVKDFKEYCRGLKEAVVKAKGRK